MKQTYMGTTVNSDAYRSFAIAAAKEGVSKAELLRQMVHNFAKGVDTPTPRKPNRRKEGAAA